MLDIFQSIILGFVQGLTEFIPVSSSGHLVIFHEILGFTSEIDLSFDAVLQLATALAVVVYFYKDIWYLICDFFRLISGKEIERNRKTLLLAIIIGTIPAIIFGLLLESYMDTIFRDSHLVAIVLIVGSIVFYFAEKFGRQNASMSVGRGFVIGLFQCLALVPGFSRSGATISGGLFSGLTRSDSAKFSFLLSVPIILGSGLKKLFDIYTAGQMGDIGVNLFVGSVVAFLVGLLAIHFLIKYLKTHSLNIFGLYRILLAILIFLAL